MVNVERTDMDFPSRLHSTKTVEIAIDSQSYQINTCLRDSKTPRYGSVVC
jgi:hypothetical protein